MINTRLLNMHDIFLIGLITILVHMLLGPLYARIGAIGQTPATSDGQ